MVRVLGRRFRNGAYSPIALAPEIFYFIAKDKVTATEDGYGDAI